MICQSEKQCAAGIRCRRGRSVGHCEAVMAIEIPSISPFGEKRKGRLHSLPLASAVAETRFGVQGREREKEWAPRGIELRTSRTRSENHTTRPQSHLQSVRTQRICSQSHPFTQQSQLFEMGFVPIVIACSFWVITLLLHGKRVVAYARVLLSLSAWLGSLLYSVIEFGIFALSVVVGYELIAFCVHLRSSERKQRARVEYEQGMEGKFRDANTQPQQLKELQEEILQEWNSNDSVRNEFGRGG